MSFTTSLSGNQPPSQFVYTTTNISVDNISVQNLSAESATITLLNTTIFTPVNVNASVISTSDLTVTNLATIGQIHTNPYVPNFSKIAAKMTEPCVGACVCASGNHV